MGDEASRDRSHDAEKDRHTNADGITSWYDEARQQTDDQPSDDVQDNEGKHRGLRPTSRAASGFGLPPSCRSSPTKTGISELLSGFGVPSCAGTLELVPDKRFVADDPRLVPWLDGVSRARLDLYLGPVVVYDVHLTGDGRAEVTCLAGVGADHGLDAFGPTPARFHGQPCRL